MAEDDLEVEKDDLGREADEVYLGMGEEPEEEDGDLFKWRSRRVCLSLAGVDGLEEEPEEELKDTLAVLEAVPLIREGLIGDVLETGGVGGVGAVETLALLAVVVLEGMFSLNTEECLWLEAED